MARLHGKARVERVVLVIRLLGQPRQRRQGQRLEQRYDELGEVRVRNGCLFGGPVKKLVDVRLAAQRFEREHACRTYVK